MYQRKNFLRVKDSDIFYRYLNFKFYFSSTSRRDLFIKRLDEYISSEEDKFLSKYNIELKGTESLFAFSLYSKIEKRGVKVQELLDERTILRTFLELPIFSITGIGVE